MLDARTRQNLLDAGCAPGHVAAFAALAGQGPEAQISFLRRYRRELLAALHRAQKKLDCLDYLIFHLQKGSQPS